MDRSARRGGLNERGFSSAQRVKGVCGVDNQLRDERLKVAPAGGGGWQMITCSNPQAQYLAHQAAIDAAMRRVLESGLLIQGPAVKAFERDFAAYIGVSHAVGVANGTDALVVALRALG